MEVARTSIIHAAAPHFLWPFAVRYAAHQLNLWPRVSLPETSPTLHWTGEVGDASAFRGPASSGVSQVDPPPLVESLVISSDTSSPAEGGDPTAVDTATTSRSSVLVTPPDFPLQPSSPPLQPVVVDTGAAGGGDTGGADAGGAGPGGAETGGAETRGAETGVADSGGAASPSGGGAVGAPSAGPGVGKQQPPSKLETPSPQQLPPRAGGAGGTGGTGGAGTAGTSGAGAGGTGGVGAAGAGGTGGVGAAGARGAGATSTGGTSTAGVGGPGGAAGAGGTGGARTRGAGAIGVGGATGGAGAAGAGGAGGTAGAGGAGGPGGAGAAGASGAGGAGAADGTGPASRRPFFYPQPHSSMQPPDSVLHQVLSLPSSTGLTPPLLCPPTDQSQPQLLPSSPLPAPAPHTEVTESVTERREPETCASTPVRARRVACPRSPAVPCTHVMALRPSSVPQRIALPSRLASSLPDVSNLEFDLARAASPTVTRLPATVVTDPDFESTAAFALVTELVDFAARRCLDYIASLNFLSSVRYGTEHGAPSPSRLMYLMTCTRPDLAYPLILLARYVAPGRHQKVHWDAVKRVLHYLCSTSGMGLVLGGRGSVVLTGHSDASWADDQATQHLSQCYTFSLGSDSVSRRSTRSSSVLGSSYEAEIYAGAMTAQELRWLTYLLTDLGERPRSPPVLYIDSNAMLALCHEQRLEHRTKHIALR
ncbi:unnamed protein product [Closterium sp. NIES-54]